MQPSFCEDSPGQVKPPKAGLGLVQVRARVRVPPPHEAEHCCQNAHEAQPPLIGQCGSRHGCLSVGLPKQVNRGLEEMQRLSRERNPLPQVAEQAPNSPHGLHVGGHGPRLQGNCSRGSPGQASGMLQVRLRLRIPSSQLTEHLPYIDQLDQAGHGAKEQATFSCSKHPLQ